MAAVLPITNSQRPPPKEVVWDTLEEQNNAISNVASCVFGVGACCELLRESANRCIEQIPDAEDIFWGLIECCFGAP